MPRPISEWTPHELLPIIPPRVLCVCVEGSGAKVRPCFSACGAEVVEHRPRLDPGQLPAGVDREDLVEVLGPVHHDGDVAAAAGQARAAAAREDRRAVLAGRPRPSRSRRRRSSGITTPIGTWR